MDIQDREIAKIVKTDSSVNAPDSSERLIGDLGSSGNGPTLVFIAGIHGNEPAGVRALKELFTTAGPMAGKMKGRVVAFLGNLKAFEQKQRFISQDLNRLWTEDQMMQVATGRLNGSANDPEVLEQIALFSEIKELLKESDGPFYFIDLHTTSSESIPFLTVNDRLPNREFAMRFNAHIILGIEEFIDGPLLGFLNELGYSSFGFEAGQHDSEASVRNNEDLLWCALEALGILQNSDLPEGDAHALRLKEAMQGERMVHEIRERFEVKPDSGFNMRPGFINFQKIRKGEELASAHGKVIRAEKGGRIFMPLYQAKGEDGYFLIRPVSPIWLGLSAVLRKLKTEKLLAVLPGVSALKDDSDTLIVRHRTAKFLATELFHLLGYRRKRTKDKVSYFIRRSKVRSGL